LIRKRRRFLRGRRGKRSNNEQRGNRK